MVSSAPEHATDSPRQRQTFTYRGAAVFDVARCKGCGLCAYVCLVGALEAGHSRIPVLDEDRCTGCRSCELICPDFAIGFPSGVPDEKCPEKKQNLTRGKCR